MLVEYIDRDLVRSYSDKDEIKEIRLAEIIVLKDRSFALFSHISRQESLTMHGAIPNGTVMIDERGDLRIFFCEPIWASVEFINIVFINEEGFYILGSILSREHKISTPISPRIDPVLERSAVPNALERTEEVVELPVPNTLQRNDGVVGQRDLRVLERTEEVDEQLIPSALERTVGQRVRCMPGRTMSVAGTRVPGPLRRTVNMESTFVQPMTVQPPKPKIRIPGTKAFTFTNCTFEGKIMELKTVNLTIFVNCIFKLTKAIGMYECRSVVFSGCTFIGTDKKSLYIDNTTCEFINCKFEISCKITGIDTYNNSEIKFDGCIVRSNCKFIDAKNKSKTEIINCKFFGNSMGSMLAAVHNETTIDVKNSTFEVLENSMIMSCDFFALVKISNCRISACCNGPCLRVFGFSKLEIENTSFDLASGIICIAKQAEVCVSSLVNMTERPMFIDLDATAILIQNQAESFTVRKEPDMVAAKDKDVINKCTGRVIPECELDSVPEENKIKISDLETDCLFCYEQKSVMMCPNGHFCGCKECLRKWKGTCPSCRCSLFGCSVPVIISNKRVQEPTSETSNE